MANSDNSGYLARMLVIITCFLLMIAWFGLYDWDFTANVWKALGTSLIPELLGPLVAFLIVYYLFWRRNIDIGNLVGANQPSDWLQKGYEDYDDIDWEPVLRTSDTLVIAAYFFEEWIVQYSESINFFMQKNDSRLIVYLPDFKDDALMQRLHTIIPEHSANELSLKIQQSITEIKKRANNKAHDVTIYLYHDIFNYTFQLFDKKMYLSVNQINRQDKFKSPFIVLDLQYSKKLLLFYRREIEALEKKSTAIKLNKWTI